MCYTIALILPKRHTTHYTLNTESFQFHTKYCTLNNAQYKIPHHTAHWDNLWKSQGCIMLNRVPWEVPRLKPEDPQVSRVFGKGTSQGTSFTMTHRRLSNTFLFFLHPRLVKREFFKSMESLGTTLKN